MIKQIKTYSVIFIMMVVGLMACKKTEYNFGDIKSPTALTMDVVIEGLNAANPNGNGSGNVAITTKANNAITYQIDFGDGKIQMVPSGTIKYRYTTPGTFEYTITANAVGTGGAVSTISKKIKVFVAFEIPANILAALTNGSTKTWETDKSAGGHFGVGPNDAFAPIWYAADPNSREACAYDDEITFTQDANKAVFMAINNKGQSFAIGAAAGFYGFSGGDNCFNIVTTGSKKLNFMNATSTSTPANSTQIQFEVPGNGIINFGTGGTIYEILSVSATGMHIRNIGIDGNAWYQKLKPK